jgi:hypothetical protein
VAEERREAGEGEERINSLCRREEPKRKKKGGDLML